MTDLDPADSGAFDRVQMIANRLNEEWQGDESVVHIGPCLKVTGGVVRPDTLAIGFHVRHKVPPETLAERGWRAVPAEIDGIPTDVITIHQPAHGTVDARSTRSAMFDTLVGGIAVGNAGINAYGTLGMTLLANSDDRLVGLTNEHVLVFDADGKVGDSVEQPRFYLQSEVSLESATCCPNGQLRYRGVINPLVLAAGAVFAAAVIAAAASDERDPHRRGQDATPTDARERTLRETVHMDIDYPTLPLPGTAFRTDVAWRYERHTDQRVLRHEVSERPRNPHITRLQVLVTERIQYLRGDTVWFVAALGPDLYSDRCNYLVTAAVISPSQRQADKVVMRPWQPADRTPIEAALTRALERHREALATHGSRYCLFAAQLRLPPDAELGTWQTFLFAQTLNDAPAAMDPVAAARVIGGLPVTHNFVDDGRTTHILYGPTCNITLLPDGEFEVIEAEPPPVIN
jgi:hypothetical protein